MQRDAETVISSPHIHSGASVGGVMRRVLMALLPGVIVSVWFLGPGVLLQIAIATLAALAAEAAMLSVRGLAKSVPRARTSWLSSSALRRMRRRWSSLAALYS